MHRTNTMIVSCALASIALAAGFQPLHAFAGKPVRKPPPPRAVRLAAGGDEIPVVKTALGITTMLVLPDEAREAVCGDLFDPGTGAGGYVVQRSGHDLFLKPLRAARPSNLFVKTTHATFAFELRVVDADSAMRVVAVDAIAPSKGLSPGEQRLLEARAALDADRARFSAAQAEAESALAARAATLDRDVAARAESLAREWASRASVARVARTEAKGTSFAVELGAYCVRIGGRTYLDCTLRNPGRAPVVVGWAELGEREADRIEVREVLPPGGTSRLTLAFSIAPTTGSTLRLLDAGGAPLVSIRPFR